MESGLERSEPDGAAATGKLGTGGGRTGRRLKGALVTRLGTAILSGEHLPGDTLTTEARSAQTLDVSRTAYREALRVLAAKGLIETRPKTGTRVLPRERWNLLDPEVLAWAFSGEPEIRLVRSLFELRSVIEPAAAGMAALRRQDDDLARMRAALDGMRRHTLATPAGRAADRSFHDALLLATGNDAFVSLGASLGALVTWTTNYKHRIGVLTRDPIPDHARVLDAVEECDGNGATNAMRRLVEFALEDTQATIFRGSRQP